MKSNGEEKINSSMLNRTLLPDYDGVVYTLDAKLIGNVGRYFNHSCSPNLVVQNVFVDVRENQSIYSIVFVCLNRLMIFIFHGSPFLPRRMFVQEQNSGNSTKRKRKRKRKLF